VKNDSDDRPVATNQRPAVFLDRDGTIIEEVEYLSDIRDLRPFHGVRRSLQMLRNSGFAVVLVTNQSGVARGYFSEEFVRSVHARLEEMLSFKFDGIYYCPHGPDDGCDCRKPKPGMIRQAVEEIGIDLDQSYMIGDKSIDIDLAVRAGFPGLLVLTGYGVDNKGKQNIAEPIYLASDFNDACKWILAKNKKIRNMRSDSP